MKKFFSDSTYLYPFFFTCLFLIILFQYQFTEMEGIFYDWRVRFDFGIRFQDDIVVVTQDEQSDEFLGESAPYSYAAHEKLLSKLRQDHPRIINYFISLYSADSNQEKENLKNFKTEIKKFIEKDRGEFRFATQMDTWGEHLPPADLREFGHSLAIMNRDSRIFSQDHVVRRMLLDVSGEDSLHLWTANEFRKYKKLAPLISSKVHGSYYMKEADATFVLFRYFTSPRLDKWRIRRIPFHKVMVGNFPKGFFTNKIVLVGPAYISNIEDFVLTPFNQNLYETPKMMVHAAIMEALIQNKTITPIDRTISNILCFILAFGLSLIILTASPKKGLIFTVGMLVSLVLVSYLLFSFGGYWLYLSHLLITLFVVYYIWVPYRAIREYRRRFAIQEETNLFKKVEGLKQNFISLMSHDLKTPVAKIAGIADLLETQYGPKDQDLREKVKMIQSSTKELNNFISSILDLTRIESKDLALDKKSKDVNEILEAIMAEFSYDIKSLGGKIEAQLGPLFPIEIDPKLIVRVFANLVENAIKYTDKMRPLVLQIKTWDDEEWVYIQIKDNGVGMGEKDLEHIFDKFYRVKNDQSHVVKGTGLGLYLVKYFVELHGGKIMVESIPGQGTTFHVQLPNA